MSGVGWGAVPGVIPGVARRKSGVPVVKALHDSRERSPAPGPPWGFWAFRGPHATIVGMTLLFLLLALAVLAVTAALVVGTMGGGMAAPTSTVPPVDLSPGPLSLRALSQVRFAPALRGYRMQQVDAVLDRVAEELAARDTEINRLQEELRLVRSTDSQR